MPDKLQFIEKLLKSLIDNEDLSIQFRSAAMQELERLKELEVGEESADAKQE